MFLLTRHPDTHNQTDEELLKLSLSSPSAFNELLLRYQDKLYRKALKILGTTADAEDAVQDTFVSIYLHAGQFTLKSSATFSAWAYTILINKCYTIYKKRKNHQGKFINISPDLEAILADKDDFKNYENRNLLSTLLNSLPKTLKRTMEKIYQGYSYEDIAKEESTAESSVRSRVHRAKKILQTRAEQLHLFC